MPTDDRPMCACGRFKRELGYTSQRTGKAYLKSNCSRCRKESAINNSERNMPKGVCDLQLKIKAIEAVADLLRKVGYSPEPLLPIKEDLLRLDLLERSR